MTALEITDKSMSCPADILRERRRFGQPVEVDLADGLELSDQLIENLLADAGIELDDE